MRQTYGWVDKYTKARKTRDRISHSQFMEKTGLSRRIISQTIPKLQRKGLIAVSDRIGKSLASGRERTGRTHIYYSLQPVHLTTLTCALYDSNLCKKVHITKLTIQN
jgi:DNA-binding transcriptional ArsR family regulator